MAGKSATLKILGNNLDAREKLAQIKEEADRLREESPELTVKINRAQAQAEMAVLKEQLRSVQETAKEPLELSADDTKALAALDDLGARIEELKATRAKIPLDLNDKAAVAKIAAIDAQLDALSAKAVDPKVGVSGIAKALAEVAALDVALDELGRKKTALQGLTGVFRAGGEFGGSLIAPTAIAAAAGPGAATVGALSGALLALGSALTPAVVGLGLFGAVVKSGITDVENANAANKKLSGGLGELQRSVGVASKSWQSFTSSALKNGGAAVIAHGISLIPSALRDVQPVLGPVEKSLDGLISKFGKALNNPEVKSGIGFLGKEAAGAITPLGGIFGHLASMALKAVAAFSPLGDEILSVLDDLTAKADAGAGNALNKFLTWVWDKGPGIVTMLKNLGVTILNMGKSFVALGHLDIGAFEVIASVLATISRSPIGAGALVGLLVLGKVLGFVGPLVRLVLAFKELSEVINITKFAMIGLDAVPIVLLISAIVVAIVLLVTHWNTVKNVAVSVWRAITGAVSTAVRNVIQWFDVLKDGITKGIGAALNWIKANWKLILAWLVDPVGMAVHEILTHTHDIAQAFDVLRHDTAAILAGIRHDISSGFDDIRHDLASFADWVPREIVHLWDTARHDTAAALDSLRHNISSGFDVMRHDTAAFADGVVSFFRQLPGRIIAAIAALPGLLLSAGRNIIDGLIHGIESAAAAIPGIMRNIAGTVVKAFTNPLAIFSPSRVFMGHGENIIKGAVIGVTNAAPQLTSAVRAIGQNIANGGLGSSRLVASVAGAGNSGGQLTAEWVGGSGADQEFISWLKRNIRIRGGNPAVLGR